MKKLVITFKIEKNEYGSYVAKIYENNIVAAIVESYSKSSIVKTTSSQKKLEEHIAIAKCFID